MEEPTRVHFQVEVPGAPPTRLDVGLFDLGPAMNEQFRALYGQILGGIQTDWVQFKAEARGYFDSVRGDAGAHDAFFNNWTAAWEFLIQKKRLDLAERIWPSSLEPAIEWEDANLGSRIHKGTPYYFWGAAAILRGDWEWAFLLIHKAVEEDRETTGSPTPGRPAWRFVTLEDEHPDQYLRPVVQNAAQFLRGQIDAYRAKYGGSLTLDEFRRKFLRNAAMRDKVFYFVYALFRAKQLVETDTRLRDDIFAPLLQLNTLLDFYMVLEEILRSQFPGTTIHDFVTQFSLTHGLGVHTAEPGTGKTRLQIVKDAFEGNPEGTLQDLLDSKFHAASLAPVESALAISPPMRNYGAHILANSSNWPWLVYSFPLREPDGACRGLRSDPGDLDAPRTA